MLLSNINNYLLFWREFYSSFFDSSNITQERLKLTKNSFRSEPLSNSLNFGDCQIPEPDTKFLSQIAPNSPYNTTPTPNSFAKTRAVRNRVSIPSSKSCYVARSIGTSTTVHSVTRIKYRRVSSKSAAF